MTEAENLLKGLFNGSEQEEVTDEASKKMLDLKDEVASLYIKKLKKERNIITSMAIGKGKNIKKYLLGQADLDAMGANAFLNIVDKETSADLQVLKSGLDNASEATLEEAKKKKTLQELNELFGVVQQTVHTQQQNTSPEEQKQTSTSTTSVPVTSPSSSVSETINALSHGAFVYPLPGWKVNSPLGPRIVFGKHGNHKGIDIAASKNTKILSVSDGIVEAVGFGGRKGYSGYGNFVVVKMNDGTRVLYGHMAKLSSLRAGDTVKKGEEIGLVGSTGTSSGNHLHLEIRKLGKDQKNENGAAFFAKNTPIVDPLSVLPVTKKDITPDALARVDKKVLLDSPQDERMVA